MTQPLRAPIEATPWLSSHPRRETSCRMSDYARVKAWREARAAEGRLKDIRAAEARKWRAKHPDVAASIKARYRAANAEVIRASDAEAKRRERKRDPQAEKRRQAAFRERKRAKQEAMMGRPRPNNCELCGASGDGPYGHKFAGIVFDHDHATGCPRGWICDRCNKVLGLVVDDPGLLRQLAAYLEDHRGEIDQQAA